MNAIEKVVEGQADEIKTDEVREGDVVIFTDAAREDMGPIMAQVTKSNGHLSVADVLISIDEVRIEKAWRPWPLLPTVQLSIVKVNNGQTYILMPKGWVRVEGGYVGAEMVARQMANFGGTVYLPGMGSPIKNGEWI